MRLARRLFLASLVLAAVAISPAAAVGAAKGTDRPLKGKATTDSTTNLATGAGTTTISGHLSHLGAFTGNLSVTSTFMSSTVFSLTGMGTLVAANGNELFATIAGSGTFTTATTLESTAVFTITGGTGRFADASGSFTETISSVVVSSSGTTVVTHGTGTIRGRISY